MSEFATEILTPELVAKVDRALEEILDNGPDCDPAAILIANGVGLVDLSRQRCLIDERVYESALHRGRVGAAYLKPREPSAKAWRFVNGSL